MTCSTRRSICLSRPPEACAIVWALALGDAVLPVLPSEAALITAGLSVRRREALVLVGDRRRRAGRRVLRRQQLARSGWLTGGTEPSCRCGRAGELPTRASTGRSPTELLVACGTPTRSSAYARTGSRTTGRPLDARERADARADRGAARARRLSVDAMASTATTASRAAAHRSAFNPSRFTRRGLRERAGDVAVSPDLDCVVVAPDGSVASYALAGSTSGTSVGELEHRRHARRASAAGPRAAGNLVSRCSASRDEGATLALVACRGDDAYPVRAALRVGGLSRAVPHAGVPPPRSPEPRSTRFEPGSNQVRERGGFAASRRQQGSPRVPVGGRGRPEAARVNRLAQETSPYLLQHAANPVDWYPWGDEALARARDEDRPILLSIGYAACHWCHVMERESFEDALTARVMNEHFVSIKVDREERPDLDSIYMDAVVALTGQRRLADDRVPDAGRRAVLRRHVLPARAAARPAVVQAGAARRSPRRGASSASEVETLEPRSSTEHIRVGARLQRLARAADGARSSTRRAERSPETLRPAVGRLGPRAEVPARAGARVPAAPRRGGDDAPHARRDGARRHVRPRRRRLPPLLGRRALARPALREDALRQRAPRVGLPARRAALRRRRATGAIADATLDYVLRELALDGGGFASAQDADTDGVEGLTFTWAPGEGAPEELLEPFEDGRFVLRGELDEATRARLLRAAREAAEAAARRQGDRLVERADARRARPGRPRSSRPSRSRSSCSARSRRRRPAASHLARRRRQGNRLPRGLRRRRVRADGAARRDRRPALAARVAPARDARGRAVRRRRRRRVLPDARRRRAARRAQEGARRPPDAERQRDARVRAAAARAHLGRRRARAARRRRCCASCATRCRARRPRSAGCSSRSTSTSRRTASSRSSAAPEDELARAALARAERDRRGRLRPGGRRPAARRPGTRSTAGRRLRLPATSPASCRSPNSHYKLTPDGAARDSRRDAAVRRDRRDRRCVARRRGGADRRADRPERRRQDDPLQRDHAALQAGLGLARASTARACCARRRTASFAAASRARSRTSSCSGR